MYIHRIAVRHWRGLEDLELTELAPGLNLVSGPNESGKSRLVQALWFALFESSKGKSEAKKDLQSHGVGSEKPRVTVEFDLAGGSWNVEKQFLGAGINTELRGPDGRQQGEAAETQLRELLRVSQPSSRGLKREDAGIWPLLWVEQHESARAPTEEVGNDARHQLQDRLSAEIGEIAAGERGQALLKRAREQRDRYYTPGRGDESGPLRVARERLASCAESLERARSSRDAIAADADRLNATRIEYDTFDERIREADERLRDGRNRQASVRLAHKKLLKAEREEEAALSRLEQAQQRAADRRDTERLLTERSERVKQLEAELRTLNARVSKAAEVSGERDEATRIAEERVEAARTILEDLRQSERRHTARKTLIDMRERLAAASEISSNISRASNALARMPELEERDVQQLSELRDACAEARARLDGSAVRFTLEADRPITVDGDVLEASATRTWSIDDNRTFTVEGVGRLRIEPGSGELATLRDALRDADMSLREHQRTLGVENVDHARSTLEQRRVLERDLAGFRNTLQREAAEGLDVLTASVDEQERRLGVEPGAAVPEPVAIDDRLIAAAEQEERAARSDLEMARARRDEARESLQAARTQLAGLESTLHAAREEQGRQAQLLEEMPTAETIDSAVSANVEALRVSGERSTEAREDFEALGGETVEEDVERLEKSLRHLRDSQSDLGREISALEERLRAAGDEGRHETVQEREAEAEQARLELERIERQARAARRLFEVLETAAREARERLAGPVVERIAPYLADLFPGKTVWLDEMMSLHGLRSELADARFDELSGGAREQLSLLVRIGLSEVLGAQESWPLVLDDALVNSDPERIERLQRLLYTASRKMQILLFTCHGRLFDALGADRLIVLPAR